ncbi:hypothetical protein JCM11251_002757 [Rhodosporidiobolus azoricus]
MPPPSTTLRSLIDIRARLHLQHNNTVPISAVARLIAQLNGDWEREGQASGGEGTGTASFLQDRIDAFRFEWMMGGLTSLKALALDDDNDDDEADEEEEVGDRSFSQETTASTATNASSFVTASEGSTPTRPRTQGHCSVPADATTRGILAEETIKSSLRRARLLFDHEDFTPLLPVVKRALKKVLRTGRAVYVSPGLVDGVDFVKEFEERGWARPGVRFGVIKPDLIKFEEVKGKEGEGRRVSWEVVEVKYSGAARKDFIYTNYKIQALFYHLTLERLLSPLSPSLVPSHRSTFFISHDPLSPTSYEEKSISIRTELAHVEHHLFVLLPKWLGCVKKEEEERLREELGKAAPSTPGRPLSSTPSFLEKLQHSVQSTPSSPTATRQRNQSPFKPGFSYSHPPSQRNHDRNRSPTRRKPRPVPVHLELEESDEETSAVPPKADNAPPVPDADVSTDEEEEDKRLRELFEQIGIA